MGDRQGRGEKVKGRRSRKRDKHEGEGMTEIERG